MKELAGRKGVLLEEPEYFGPQEFQRVACDRFPELQADLEENAGLVDVLMSVLANAARSQIEAGNLSRSAEIFSFLEELLADPATRSTIEDAVRLSFLVPSELQETHQGREASELTPPLLRNLLLQGEGQ